VGNSGVGKRSYCIGRRLPGGRSLTHLWHAKRCFLLPRARLRIVRGNRILGIDPIIIQIHYGLARDSSKVRHGGSKGDGRMRKVQWKRRRRFI
jgi:hypothetical protein